MYSLPIKIKVLESNKEEILIEASHTSATALYIISREKSRQLVGPRAELIRKFKNERV